MSIEALRDYCDRLDATRGKVNGSPSSAAPLNGSNAEPILREPIKPPESASLQALNDYYAAKKRWNEQQAEKQDT